MVQASKSEVEKEGSGSVQAAEAPRGRLSVSSSRAATRSVDVPTHTGAVVLSGIEPPPLAPSEATCVLSARTSPVAMLPSPQPSQQQQQQQQQQQGERGIDLDTAVPPTALPGTPPERPSSPFAADPTAAAAEAGSGVDERGGSSVPAGRQGSTATGADAAATVGPGVSAGGSAAAAPPTGRVEAGAKAPPAARKLSHTQSAFAGLQSGRTPSATDLDLWGSAAAARCGAGRAGGRMRAQARDVLCRW